MSNAHVMQTELHYVVDMAQRLKALQFVCNGLITVLLMVHFCMYVAHVVFRLPRYQLTNGGWTVRTC